VALEALALGLNVVCLVLHTILAATGYSSWLSVCTDVLAIVSDGLGAGAIGGIKATAEVAEGVEEGTAVATEAEAESGDLALTDSSDVGETTSEAGTSTNEAQNALGHREYQNGSGFFGKLSKEDFQGLNAKSVVQNFKSVWEDNLSEGQWRQMFTDSQTGQMAVGKTLRGAAANAFTLHNPEITEEIGKLDEPDTIAQLTRLARTQYRFDMAHYTTMWDVSKVLDLSSDGIDKLNLVTEFMGGHLPGYSNLEDAMKTGGSGG
jgi:hypothetical protein